jgi:hypothetical protein
MRDSRIESQRKLTQETGKDLFAMDGVQNFFSLSFISQGCETRRGAGKLRKNGLPRSTFIFGKIGV